MKKYETITIRYYGHDRIGVRTLSDSLKNKDERKSFEIFEIPYLEYVIAHYNELGFFVSSFSNFDNYDAVVLMTKEYYDE